MKNRTVLLLTAATLVFTYLAGSFYLSDGFSISKIQTSPLYSSNWVVDNPSIETLRTITEQPFYYLGKGSQCYVFQSADGNYVLKFFRFNRYRVPSLLQFFQKEKMQKKQDRLTKLFESCTLAFRELKEDAALIYLHINTTSDLHQNVVIYDALKRCYCISLDDTAFIIQKKGEHVFPYLTKLMTKDNSTEVQTAIASLFSLLERRLEKGVFDEDAVVHKNAGFCEGRAIFLDIGEFVKKEIESPEQELRKITHTLSEWISKNHPLT